MCYLQNRLDDKGFQKMVPGKIVRIVVESHIKDIERRISNDTDFVSSENFLPKLTCPKMK